MIHSLIIKHDGTTDTTKFMDGITGSAGSTGSNLATEPNGKVSSDPVHPADPVILSNSCRRARRAALALV
jgi:hypothetical protein